MLIVHVHVHVKPESVADFRKPNLENARSSVQKPGITQFDVVVQQGDVNRFVLIEVYRSAEAAAAHKVIGSVAPGNRIFGNFTRVSPRIDASP
jgi:(4S)-4-hydroxy-5-phosphonooxypentane-2,3-dione isomerase